MGDAEYTHEGDACTFEVLCSKFRLTQLGLRPLSQIIHDIDVKDSKFERPETAGIAALIDGVAALHREDEARLRTGAELLDALFSHFDTKQE